MKIIVFIALYLSTTVFANGIPEQCKDVSKLVKHVYNPKDTHIKRGNFNNKWGIDVKTTFFNEKIDKNHPLYGKAVIENLYCLDDTPETCDINNTWIPIKLAKLSITKGKKVICDSSSSRVYLNPKTGRHERKSTFYFYTEN